MTRERPEPVSDAAVLVLLGLATLSCGIVWLWGGLAGALFGKGWPPAGISQLLGVLIRLPAHVTHPADAWPLAARARLPSTPALYVTLGVLLAAAGFACVVAIRAMGWSGLRREDNGARWAGGLELRRLRRHHLRAAPRCFAHRAHGTSQPSGRLVLGRHRSRRLYAEERHALVAFGPPQSGKSAGLAVPALLEWAGPAVASSIKTDLLTATLARRRELGSVYVFDPFGLAGRAGDTWSPLNRAGTWDGALEVAWRLAAAGELDQRGVEGGDFWAIAAEQRLAPLLYAAARGGGGITDLVRWTYGQGGRELDETLARITGEAGSEAELTDAHAAYDALRAFECQADRTRSSIEATAQALLRAYRFTRVTESARGCSITADRLLDEPATLYLIGDAKASKLLRPLFLALLGEVVDRAYERATLAGGRLELPLLLCLDEAGNVAPLPNLAEIASTAPSHNIQLVSIFHDLAQARSRYRGQAETVINSHRARMLLAGVGDLDTLRYFAGLVGEEEVREVTRTTGGGGTSRSTGRRRRPLVSAEALRQLPDHEALLIYGRIPPVRLRLRLWFEDRRLRRLAGNP